MSGKERERRASLGIIFGGGCGCGLSFGFGRVVLKMMVFVPGERLVDRIERDQRKGYICVVVRLLRW